MKSSTTPTIESIEKRLAMETWRRVDHPMLPWSPTPFTFGEQVALFFQNWIMFIPFFTLVVFALSKTWLVSETILASIVIVIFSGCCAGLFTFAPGKHEDIVQGHWTFRFFDPLGFVMRHRARNGQSVHDVRACRVQRAIEDYVLSRWHVANEKIEDRGGAYDTLVQSMHFLRRQVAPPYIFGGTIPADSNEGSLQWLTKDVQHADLVITRESERWSEVTHAMSAMLTKASRSKEEAQHNAWGWLLDAIDALEPLYTCDPITTQKASTICSKLDQDGHKIQSCLRRATGCLTIDNFEA